VAVAMETVAVAMETVAVAMAVAKRMMWRLLSTILCLFDISNLNTYTNKYTHPIPLQGDIYNIPVKVRLQ
jgi:hypothetical protein